MPSLLQNVVSSSSGNIDSLAAPRFTRTIGVYTFREASCWAGAGELRFHSFSHEVVRDRGLIVERSGTNAAIFHHCAPEGIVNEGAVHVEMAENATMTQTLTNGNARVQQDGTTRT